VPREWQGVDRHCSPSHRSTGFDFHSKSAVVNVRETLSTYPISCARRNPRPLAIQRQEWPDPHAAIRLLMLVRSREADDAGAQQQIRNTGHARRTARSVMGSRPLLRNANDEYYRAGDNLNRATANGLILTSCRIHKWRLRWLGRSKCCQWQEKPTVPSSTTSENDPPRSISLTGWMSHGPSTITVTARKLAALGEHQLRLTLRPCSRYASACPVVTIDSTHISLDL
jgi:hypothetical protein